MTPERLQRIEDVYHRAMEFEPRGRASFIATACAGDEALRKEIESLIAANGSLPDFLAGTTESVVSPGTQFGPYRIESPLGSGGMGEVYRATDTRLQRTVAIKVLPSHLAWNPEMRQRFEREAKMLSSLNHPNVCTLYDIGREGVVDYLVMECVAGETLGSRIPPSGLPVSEALAIARSVGAALAAAHKAGIVHRDLKPANVMITADGTVKVMDFGLAKVASPSAPIDRTRTIDQTAMGAVMGTASYMSPEQAEGKTLDARSDVFAFGALLYEMLTGRRAFQGDTLISTISAVLKDTPPAIQKIRGDLTPALAAVVNRCLSKDREARYSAGTELEAALAPLDRRAMPRWKMVAAVGALVAAIAAGGWWGVKQWRARWVYSTAIPEIHRLYNNQENLASYRLAMRARKLLPGDPNVELAIGRCCPGAKFQTQPPGARIYYRPYLEPSAAEEFIGQTPLSVPMPLALVRLRIVKDGYEDVESGFEPMSNPAPLFLLDRKGDRPPGMVKVNAGSRVVDSKTIPLPPYWLDKYEVSNRDFKTFIDRGGYRKREYWKYPFRKEGVELSWEHGIGLLVDSTGRPGPATWELGAYPENRGHYPVGGVSWYEAAAYAEFAGKSLPTVAHWQRAAGFGQFSEILELSNFGGQGSAPAGKYLGLGPFGTYDMAGNLKEWGFNAVGDLRPSLGGSWQEASYRFRDFDAREPLERLPTLGFRCAKFREPPPSVAFEPIKRSDRDPSNETPVSDETFSAWRNSYAYDHTPLEAHVEDENDSSEYYRKIKVSIAAAYGGERMPVWLFLPKNALPPYQTIVYYPSGEATQTRDSRHLGPERYLQFIMRSGRALAYPVYKGTYERIGTAVEGPNGRRERVVQALKDLRRSVDYLETRKDIDIGRLAYYGISQGCREGTVMVAMEPRFRAAVLAYCGIPVVRTPDGVDPLDFAPRIQIPTLLLEARDDFGFPYRTSQLPLFHLLGSPEKDKKMVLRAGGHILAFPPETFREILDWLDRYLGPVK